MDMATFPYFFILILFLIGYALIIFEHSFSFNKAGIAILTAVLCWTVYFVYSANPLEYDLKLLAHHVSDTAQIIFFIMGAMALVELIDSHRGFKIITDLIRTRNQRTMLWLLALIAFFLSSVLDNLTTTILMISLLRKLISDKKERIVLGCVVVIASNAGGAWSPIGDITTTMLWINGQITAGPIISALLLPSLVALFIPLAIYSFSMKGSFHLAPLSAKEKKPEPGAGIVFTVGILGLIFVPIFKGLTGLPPFMGILLALAVLWVVTDLLHLKDETRAHLTLTHALRRIDMAAVLFFLGILLTIHALDSAGILRDVAHYLNREVKSMALFAILLGFFSAILDNVPLVAATMGMYPMSLYPTDDQFWHLITYAAGTGGSILIIGSSSGVALMGLEKVDFMTYLKKAALPALLGFLGGMGVYLLLS
jgi:Na+/H+ antiporter NhaD/arsenite permease-like protein